MSHCEEVRRKSLYKRNAPNDFIFVSRLNKTVFSLKYATGKEGSGQVILYHRCITGR
jgi:hypothetical protein